MTTFKQFLLEEESDFSSFKKNAKIMLDNQIFLYRGTGTAKNSFDVDADHTGFIAAARTIERHAKGSAAAMRISAEWEIPNRKLSYFVTRDAEHASLFARGSLLFVIPADDVSQFAWTGTDFNQGKGDDYKKQFSDMESATRALLYGMAHLTSEDEGISIKLIKMVTDLGGKISQLGNLAPESTPATDVVDGVLKMYDEIEAAPRTIDDAIKRKTTVDYVAKNVFQLLDTIKTAMRKTKSMKAADVYANATPKAFKIKTFNDLSKIPKKLKSPDELWFNGRYLAVNLSSRHHTAEDMHKILQAILEK